MDLLSILGGGGRATSEFFDERKADQLRQQEEEERAKQQKLQALTRMMGLLPDAESKRAFLQGQGQALDPGGALASAYDRQLQEQQQAQQAQQQERDMSRFKAQNQGRKLNDFDQREPSEQQIIDYVPLGLDGRLPESLPNRAITDDELGQLGQAGQGGYGLDALMGMRRKLQGEVQDTQASMRAQQDAQLQKQRNDMLNKIGSAKDIDALRSLRVTAKEQFGQDSDIVKIIDERMGAGFGMPETPSASGQGGDPKLTAEEQKRQTLFTVLNTDVDALLGVIDEPRVQNVLGTAGSWNQFRQDNPTLSNAMSPLLGEIPSTFTAVQGVVSGIAEKYLRLLTGAAAQDAEVIRIANRQVGNIKMSPTTLKTLLKTFKNSLQTELDVLSGQTLTPAQAELRLAGLLDSLNEAEDSEGQQQGGSPRDYNPQGNQPQPTYDPQTGWQ